MQCEEHTWSSGGILKVWVHLGVVVEEPCSYDIDSVLGCGLVVKEESIQRKRDKCLSHTGETLRIIVSVGTGITAVGSVMSCIQRGVPVMRDIWHASGLVAVLRWPIPLPPSRSAPPVVAVFELRRVAFSVTWPYIRRKRSVIVRISTTVPCEPSWSQATTPWGNQR